MNDSHIFYQKATSYEADDHTAILPVDHFVYKKLKALQHIVVTNKLSYAAVQWDCLVKEGYDEERPELADDSYDEVTTSAMTIHVGDTGFYVQYYVKHCGRCYECDRIAFEDVDTIFAKPKKGKR